jgi:hypothetical protein
LAAVEKHGFLKVDVYKDGARKIGQNKDVARTHRYTQIRCILAERIFLIWWDIRFASHKKLYNIQG